MHVPWLLAVIAGAAVVISSTVARRIGGPWAGVLAAAPITPTFSALLLGDEAGPAMLSAVPLVVWTLGAILIILLARHPMAAVIPGVVMVMIVFAPAAWTTAQWVVVGIATAAAARLLRPLPGTSKGRLPMVARFCIGVGVVLAVALAKHALPGLAGWIAMAPWLFIAATAAAAFDGGWAAAARVLHGGIGGALGVIAFAIVIAIVPGLLLALPLAWLAFAAVAITWSVLPYEASTGWPTLASAE